jgi:hypothetical protein
MRSSFHTPIPTLVACAALLTATSATAGTRGIVAVLPFDFHEAHLDDAARTTLVEAVRSMAGDELSPLGFTVLTGDNTLAVLADNNIDPAKACDSSCSLAAARELKANLFISATVTTTEGTHHAFVRLFEAKHGTQLASVELRGNKVLELEESFRERRAPFFRKGLAQYDGTGSTAFAGKEGPLQDTSGHFEVAPDDRVLIHFRSTPPGAVLHVDGDLLCQATPCDHLLSRGVHEIVFQRERYDRVKQDMKATKEVEVTVVLPPRFGTLAVETTPPDLPVTVQRQGKTGAPMAPGDLDPGNYEVRVDAPCWRHDGEAVELHAGDSRTVRIAARPREAGVRVTARDTEGNDVKGDVEADGEPIGLAPGTFKVPVCSRLITVRTADGRAGGENLSLREGGVTDVKVVVSTQGLSLLARSPGKTGRGPFDAPATPAPHHIPGWAWWTGGIGAAVWAVAGLSALSVQTSVRKLSPGDPAIPGTMATGTGFMVAANVGAAAVVAGVIGGLVGGP